MALNKYMHPCNPYRHRKPNFKLLAEKYPFFKEIAQEDENGRVNIDFKMPSHLAALSKALLLEDFGLSVELPLDRLVPTVPLRLNYILWLEDIVKSFIKPFSPVRILDVGVGASCIYPLLGAKKNAWNFVGTETDHRNFIFAQENVARNCLQNLVKLVHVKEDESSLDAAFSVIGDTTSNTEPHLDVVMANPPFFCDTSDSIGTTTSRSITRPVAKTVSSAARQESQTRGGEVFFCMRLARDSVKYATRVGVFTVMLGKKSSVVPMKRILRKLKIPRISVYELCQGRIMRWGLAWTFLPGVEFPESEFRRLRKLERPPLSLTLPPSVTCLPKYTVDGLLDWLRNEFRQLKMKVLDQKNRADIGGIHLSITAMKNTWTHARRKRREAQRLMQLGEQASGASHCEEPKPNVSLASQANGHIIATPGSKRSHEEPTDVSSPAGTDQLVQLGSVDSSEAVDPKPDDSIKRARLVDEVCEEGDACWFEEQVSPILSEDHISPVEPKPDPVIQADVFVEHLSEDQRQFTTSDADDEGEEPEELMYSSQPGGPLVVKIAWTGGSCREAANQILCYLKNRLR